MTSFEFGNAKKVITYFEYLETLGLCTLADFIQTEAQAIPNILDALFFYELAFYS